MSDRLAIIDLGTNTFHLLIIEKTKDATHVLHKEKRMVRIGENGIIHGYINDSAINRAIDATSSFRMTINKFRVAEVHVTATSAVREAENSNVFIRKIKESTDLEVKVISGEKEAELIYYGVKSALDLGKLPSLIMDIGGGSVEFIIGNCERIFWKESFPIGAQILLDRFHKSDPIQKEDILEIENFLRGNLGPLVEKLNEFSPNKLVGASGSFDTLSDIFIRKHNLPAEITNGELPLEIDGFFEIYDDILRKNREERMQIPGMIEMRVDMIVVASILIKHILICYKFKGMRVSSYALKEGVLYCISEGLEYY